MQTEMHAGEQRRVTRRRHAVATLFAASATLAVATGCRSSAPPAQQATIIDNSPAGSDPANLNLADAGPYTQASAARPAKVRVLGQQQAYSPQQNVEQYPQQAPAPSGYPESYQPPYDAGVENAGYNAIEQADQPPPPLPVYEQPPAPEPNDLWTPGYWNYAPAGYFWVPGAWVAAPYPGALWTPGYWGYESDRYRFHRGFWARHIGFYGGVNYGHGYAGLGYSGGYWNGNNFYYNRAVNRVNVTNIHNVYERNVTVNNITRVSYNGGSGLQARPDPRELAVLHEQRIPAMSTQIQLRQQSETNRQQFFNQNHGQPAEAFVPHSIPAERGIATPQAQPFQQQGPAETRQQQFEQQRIAHQQQPQPATQPNALGLRPQPGQPRALQQQAEQRNVPAQQQIQTQQHLQSDQQQRLQSEQQRAQADQQLRLQADQQRRLQADQQHAQATQQQQHLQAEQQQQRLQAEQQQRLQIQQQQRTIQQQPHPQQFTSRPEPMQRPEPQPQPQRSQPQAQPQLQHFQPQPQPLRVQPQPHIQPQSQEHPQSHPGGGRPN